MLGYGYIKIMRILWKQLTIEQYHNDKDDERQHIIKDLDRILNVHGRFDEILARGAEIVDKEDDFVRVDVDKGAVLVVLV